MSETFWERKQKVWRDVVGHLNATGHPHLAACVETEENQFSWLHNEEWAEALRDEVFSLLFPERASHE